MLLTLKRTGSADPAPPGLVARLVLLVGPALRDHGAPGDPLSREGVRCLWLSSVAEALEAARLARFDALVLDSAAPVGPSVPPLVHLRQQLACPIVVVADQADEIDEILALELGADAFLVRPLAPRRLRAHLMALMRASAVPVARGLAVAMPAESGTGQAVPGRGVRFSGWALDTHSGSLVGADRRVGLTAVQTALLHCLASAAGRVVSPAQPTAALPGGQQLAPHSVYVYVTRLRKRLIDAGVHDVAVEVVRGRGFVLRSAGFVAIETVPVMQAA